jgi:hypothetical protein
MSVLALRVGLCPANLDERENHENHENLRKLENLENHQKQEKTRVHGFWFIRR